jgi:hypothetical protein
MWKKENLKEHFSKISFYGRHAENHIRILHVPNESFFSFEHYYLKVKDLLGTKFYLRVVNE